MVSPSALQLPHSIYSESIPFFIISSSLQFAFPSHLEAWSCLPDRLRSSCGSSSRTHVFDGTVSHVSSSSFLPSHIPFVKFTVPLDSVAIETPRLDRADIIDLSPSPSLANRPPWRIHPRPLHQLFQHSFPTNQIVVTCPHHGPTLSIVLLARLPVRSHFPAKSILGSCGKG